MSPTSYHFHHYKAISFKPPINSQLKIWYSQNRTFTCICSCLLASRNLTISLTDDMLSSFGDAKYLFFSSGLFIFCFLCNCVLVNYSTVLYLDHVINHANRFSDLKWKKNMKSDFLSFFKPICEIVKNMQITKRLIWIIKLSYTPNDDFFLHLFMVS